MLSAASGRVKPKEKLSFESSLTVPHVHYCFPLDAQFREKLQAKLGGTRFEVLAVFILSEVM